MHTWTTNSQTIRASSPTATGSYVREEVQFPIWSHEVDVVLAPSGQYVAYFSHMPTGKAPECTVCTDGSTSKACKKMDSSSRGSSSSGSKVSGVDIEVSPPTFMSYSLTTDPRGAWSVPELVLMPKPMMDINVAPVRNFPYLEDVPPPLSLSHTRTHAHARVRTLFFHFTPRRTPSHTHTF